MNPQELKNFITNAGVPENFAAQLEGAYFFVTPF